MSEAKKSFRVSEGDWVGGASVNGERIRGYVEGYDALTGMATVYVLESDREEAVGRTAYAREGQLKRLADDVLSSPEALREMIDLALAVRDEAWFYELSAELIALLSQRGMLAAHA